MRRHNGQGEKEQDRSFVVTFSGPMLETEDAEHFEEGDIIVLESEYPSSIRVSIGDRTFRGDLVVMEATPQDGFPGGIGIHLKSLEAKRGASSTRA